jgi:hypothetical protein
VEVIAPSHTLRFSDQNTVAARKSDPQRCGDVTAKQRQRQTRLRASKIGEETAGTQLAVGLTASR